DATGHGIGPALSVSQVHAMLRMGRRLGATPEDIARHINRQLCEDLPAGRFVTAFFGLLDARRHEISYVSAGQAPILVIHCADGGAWSRDVRNATGMTLGIDSEMEFEPDPPLRLERGDTFVLLSDGYYEAGVPSGELFGLERVVRAMQGAWSC